MTDRTACTDLHELRESDSKFEAEHLLQFKSPSDKLETPSHLNTDSITNGIIAFSHGDDILLQKDNEINKLTKLVAKYERQLEKSNKYNEDLRHELSILSSELHKYRCRNSECKSVQTQVTEVDIEEAYGYKPMPEWTTKSEQGSEKLSIADSIKAAAEAELNNQLLIATSCIQVGSEQHNSEVNSDYVFDTSTGLYYHPSTGYYWDPNYELFYDNATGTYYKYNENSGEYEVHSQVDLTEHSTMRSQDGSHSEKPFSTKAIIQDDLGSLSSRLSVIKIDPQKCKKNALELADEYPSCIRVIVQSSEHLTCGSLYMVTCTGGSIGRDKNIGHSIEIDDINVSKVHAEIVFNYEKNCYSIWDKGSQNGTLLNGSRLPQNKLESDCQDLKHNDLLQIGGTTFLLHIHKGNDTCDECEPGQVQAKIKAASVIKNDYVILTQEEKNRQRKTELKKIKKKYGLQNSYYDTSNINPDFCDKAYLRRKFVGSESDFVKQYEVTASVHSPISAQNRGHKLLAKMGWKEGQGLGKEGSGITEPINVELRVNQNSGLGSATNVSLSLDNVQNSRKTKRWVNAKNRYDKLNKTDNADQVHLPGGTSSINNIHELNQGPNATTLPGRPADSFSTRDSVSQDCPISEVPDTTKLFQLKNKNSSSLNEDATLSAVQNPLNFDLSRQQTSQAFQHGPKMLWVSGGIEQTGLHPPS